MSKSKPKICFVTPFFYPVIGGVETHILEVSKELMKKGYEIEVITSDFDRKSTIELKQEVYNKIKIKRVHSFFQISFGELFMPGIFKAIRQSDADIFHFHGLRHMYNLAEFFTKKPCFITPHWSDYRGQRNFAIQAIIDLIDITLSKKMLNRCQRICAVTDLEKDWLFSLGADKNKIIVTPNALNSRSLSKVNPNKFINKYNLRDSTVILSLSRVHKSKGIDQLINVARFFPDVKFVIAGKDGGFQSELEGMVKKDKLNNVIFTGQLTENEKDAAYSSADIFCAPSHFEAFNISLLEAMAHSCAVISSDKGGMPWVVGNAGLTFKDNDLNDLKEKLSKLLNNKKLRTELQKKALKRAKEFTWKKTSDILDKEYSRVI